MSLVTAGFNTEWFRLLQAFQAGEVRVESVPLPYMNNNEENEPDGNDDYDWEPPPEMDDEVQNGFQVLSENFIFRPTPYNTLTEPILAETDVPLFENSLFTAKDFFRFMLHLQSSNAGIGDRLFSSIIGAIIRFLPPDNVLATALKQNPSMYRTLKMVHSGADIRDDLKSYLLDTCPSGCRPFWGASAHEHICSEEDCGGCRWKYCNADCVNDIGDKICDHKRKPARQFYYLSVRDRIVSLLNSDLRRLFQYESLRHVRNDSDFVEDIYDSTTYKTFSRIIPPNAKLIFLQICWDGADMFSMSGKSMWPLCYSIMNLPPNLRDKPHIGK